MAFKEVHPEIPDESLFNDVQEPFYLPKHNDKETIIQSLKTIPVTLSKINSLIACWLCVATALIFVGILVSNWYGGILMAAGAIIIYDAFRIIKPGTFIKP